mmetsp:Transcript_30319/g.102298  ORF Transcript_30319/g.102298 Transcript_30319/m.102298 type:complete len:224 (-) Transcript_30319:1533-2204(-)
MRKFFVRFFSVFVLPPACSLCWNESRPSTILALRSATLVFCLTEYASNSSGRKKPEANAFVVLPFLAPLVRASSACRFFSRRMRAKSSSLKMRVDSMATCARSASASGSASSMASSSPTSSSSPDSMSSSSLATDSQPSSSSSSEATSTQSSSPSSGAPSGRSLWHSALTSSYSSGSTPASYCAKRSEPSICVGGSAAPNAVGLRWRLPAEALPRSLAFNKAG